MNSQNGKGVCPRCECKLVETVSTRYEDAVLLMSYRAACTGCEFEMYREFIDAV
jgi:hypothetical protein